MGLFGSSDEDLRRRVQELERRVIALERALGSGPRSTGELTEAPGVEILKPHAGVSDLVRQLAIQGDKMAAIKLLRDETGLGLREAKDVVDGLA